VNISGNNVSKSILKRAPACPRRSPARAQILLGAAGQEQGAKGIDRHPLSSDYFADVIRVHPQFVNGQGVLNHRSHGHIIRMIHQPFDHVFQKGLHKP
jgi:hypothetical protein